MTETKASRGEPREAKLDAVFATAARKEGFITDEQLLEALDMQVLAKRHLGHHIPLDEILFVRGALTVEQLRKLLHDSGVPTETTLRISGRGLFGQIAVDRGYVKKEDLIRCLEIQESDVKAGRGPRPLGEVMIAEKILTHVQLEEILRYQKHR